MELGVLRDPSICFPSQPNRIRSAVSYVMPSDRPLFPRFPHEDYLAHQTEIDTSLAQMLTRGRCLLDEDTAGTIVDSAG